MLSWQKRQQCLSLQGELTVQTLLPLWQQRAAVMQNIQQLDVSQLTKVDTAGLSLLLHLINQSAVTCQLTGVRQELVSLITLCNLQTILAVA